MNLPDRLAATFFGRVLFETAGRVGPPRLPILIFHRVLREPDPLQPDEMTAVRFERLCAHLAANFRVLPLSKAVQALANRVLEPRSLAITFDDGYADNVDCALPILKRHGLVASFFIATGFIDGGRMFNDSVIESVRRSKRSVLDLDSVGLGVHAVETLGERRQAIAGLLRLVKHRPPDERDRLVSALHVAAGSPALPDDLMMRGEQIGPLVREGMEVGAHTVHHPILASIPDDAALQEVAASRSRLEALADAPVETFAYPNGRRGDDFDERHVRIVHRLGFKAAVTTERGAARSDDDLLALPRFTPWQPQLWRWSAQLARTSFERRSVPARERAREGPSAGPAPSAH